MTKQRESISQNTELKPCFIITPIGGNGSETFIKTDGLIKTVLEPILKEFGFRPLPAYEISSNGSITKQVIEHVINDELVIANLTGLNPNVMYELAIRHAFKKKVITMAEYDTVLPFDISDQRTIKYHDSLHGSSIVKPILADFIREALSSEVTSNPIIDSIKEAAVINSTGSEDTTKYLLNRFDRLERMLASQTANISYDRKESLYTGRTAMRLEVSLSAPLDDEITKIIKDLAANFVIKINSIISRAGKIIININQTPETRVQNFLGALSLKLDAADVSYYEVM